MNGTGTQTDPFILKTAEDLYAMEEAGGSGVYCRLDADIDLNSTEYAEKFKPIPVNWSYLDGAGHKIRNICNSDPMNRVSAFNVMISGNIEISGLMLENVVMQGTVINLFYADTGISANISIFDCAFVMKLNRTGTSVLSGSISSFHNSNIKMTFDLSVVALSSIDQRGCPLFSSDTVKRTHIILDVLTHDSGGMNVYETALFRKVNMSDTWLTGKVTCDANIGSYTIYHMTDSNCDISNCYQAVKMSGVTYVYWSGSFGSVCFYDKELMGDASYDSSGFKSDLFKGLTTEQCKDPEYLASIGFLCGGGNDSV